MKIEIALQPKQKEALKLSELIPVLLYGGAKGGGKSHLIRAREVVRRLKYAGSKGLIVRKTHPELLSNHIRRFFVEYPMTAKWYRKAEKAIYWPNGSITEFSYLKNTDDVYTYQGREYEDISIDEITQHEEEVFKILRSSNRTTNPKIKPTMLLTGNPGGVGHGWVKRIFIDRQFKDNENPKDFGFVSAKVQDNKALIDADPDYIKRLDDLPEHLRRAYKDGDWDVFAGQVFDFRPTVEQKEYHVIKPKPIPELSTRFFAIDWGGDAPVAIGWYAVINCLNKDGVRFQRIWKYRELYYGVQRELAAADDFKERTGLDFTDKNVAKIIAEKSEGEEIEYGVGDPSMANRKPRSYIVAGKSIMESMNEYWDDNGIDLFIKAGDNDRKNGLDRTRYWMSKAPDGKPYYQVFNTCDNTIRTYPLLIYDEGKDDVDCFIAGTKVLTVNGEKAIEDVKLNDLVLTPVGYRRVIKDGISGRANTIEIFLSNGDKLIGTLNHKIVLKNKGLTELKNCKINDILIMRNSLKIWSLKQLFTKILDIIAIKVEDITRRLQIISKKDTQHFIGRFILIILVKSLQKCTYIIRTMIMMTIVPRTLRWLILKITQNIILAGEKIYKKNSRIGVKVKKAKKLLDKTIKKCLNEHQKGGSRVEIVKNILQQSTQQKNIVQKNARKKQEIGNLKRFVLFVKKLFGQKEIQKRKQKPVHIVAVGNIEERLVYNLTIEDAHLYFANDILVTNTDVEDHCLSGNTLVDTTGGQIKIKDLVGKEGFLYSRDDKIKPFFNVRQTGIKQTYKIEFEDGRKIIATAEHPFLMSDGGWKQAIDLRPLDMIQCVNVSKSNRQNHTGVSGRAFLSLWQILQSSIKKIQGWKKITQDCLATLQWECPRRLSCSSQGWQCQQQPNRKLRISKGRQTFIKTYLNSRTQEICKMAHGYQNEAVGKQVAQVKRGQKVAQQANKKGLEKKKENNNNLSYMRKRIQNLCTKLFQILSFKLQTKSSQVAKVRKVRHYISSPVFNLEVKDTHCFSVNGGIIVHNCYDKDRYAFMSRPYGASEPKVKTPEETQGTFEWHLKQQRKKRVLNKLATL